MLKKIGILYHPMNGSAGTLAKKTTKDPDRKGYFRLALFVMGWGIRPDANLRHRVDFKYRRRRHDFTGGPGCHSRKKHRLPASTWATLAS